MATLVGGSIPYTVVGAVLKTLTLSGTVKLSGVGVVRTILLYKNAGYEVPSSTTSDASGNWSFDVIAGTNDKFRIIALGIDGENSEIFDYVQR